MLVDIRGSVTSILRDNRNLTTGYDICEIGIVDSFKRMNKADKKYSYTKKIVTRRLNTSIDNATKSLLPLTKKWK